MCFKEKIIFKFLMFLTIFFVITFSSVNAAPIQLKLATSLPEDNIITTEAKFFAERVEDKTNGNVKITVYPLTLGDTRACLEGIQIGTIDMTFQAELTLLSPEPGIFSLPFLFKNWDHLSRVLDSEPAKKIADLFLKKTGARVLGWMEQGFRVIISRKKPIETVEDLKGFKIRVPEDKVLVRTFELLGARPVVIPWADTYTSLQTGLVEGMEATPPGLYSMKFYEVTNYLTLTNHIHSVLGALINEKVWNSLGEENQKALEEAMKEMIALNRKESRENANLMLMELVNEHKITYNPDTTPFQEKVKPIYDEWGKNTGTGSLIEEILKIK